MKRVELRMNEQTTLKPLKTNITDHLHQIYGFHIDYEFIAKISMRNIIKNTKITNVKEN